jgi:hypothetical protein
MAALDPSVRLRREPERLGTAGLARLRVPGGPGRGGRVREEGFVEALGHAGKLKKRSGPSQNPQGPGQGLIVPELAVANDFAPVLPVRRRSRCRKVLPGR